MDKLLQGFSAPDYWAGSVGPVWLSGRAAALDWSCWPHSAWAQSAVRRGNKWLWPACSPATTLSAASAQHSDKPSSPAPVSRKDDFQHHTSRADVHVETKWRIIDRNSYLLPWGFLVDDFSLRFLLVFIWYSLGLGKELAYPCSASKIKRNVQTFEIKSPL